MDNSHAMWRLVHLFLLFTVWKPGVLVEAGINSTHLHMGRDITRITSNGFQDIYIGGVNFIAQLTNKLFLKVNLTIGPVTTKENCAPNPVPCDNTVRVLEIDPVQKMLLVCGSAYRGTCTLHNLTAIDAWFCLNNATNDGADVVSGSHERSSVVHFLPSTTGNSRLVPDARPVASRGCRPGEFGQKYGVVFLKSVGIRLKARHFENSNKALNKLETRENANSSQSQGGNINTSMSAERNSEYPIQSNVMIAGSEYNPNVSINPLHLSIRSITFDGSNYTIGYSRGQDSTPVGFQMKNANDVSISPDYKLSFTWDNYSYFVFLQQSTDCGRSGRCIHTKISRTCHDPSSILPYVEITLKCVNQTNKYSLLNSAVLGTVGLVHSTFYANVPVLVMSFGNNSNPASSTVESIYGTAVCAVTLDELNKEFKYTQHECTRGNSYYIAKHASWITGSLQNCTAETIQSGLCLPNTKNKYVQNVDVKDMQAIAFIKDLSVLNVLTQTHVVAVDGQGRSSLNEVMDIFLLTNVGSLKKISLRADFQDPGFYVKLESPLVDFTKLTEAVTSQSVGITDHVRAVIYVTAGPKIIEFGLEFCLQLQNCAECLAHTTECEWCPVENKCRDRKLTKTMTNVCSSTVARCQPILTDFAPTKVPTDGGSVLSIIGFNLGGKDEGWVKVTVCGQPCDDVMTEGTRITCKVRSCYKCPDKCDLAISVSYRSSEGNTSTSQMQNQKWVEYLKPNVTSFSPTFGPSRGGTEVWFKGQNLKIGSSTNITVGDALCDVQPGSELSCRIEVNETRQPKNETITVEIDNFKVTLSKRFRFRNNPIIQNISTLKTIASGGVTIAVTGMNIDSVASSVLTFSLPKTSGMTSSNCTSIFSQKCNTPVSKMKMTCKTPDISDCIRNNATVRVAIYMDGKDMLYPEFQKMTVHANPTLRDAIFDTPSRSLLVRSPADEISLPGDSILSRNNATVRVAIYMDGKDMLYPEFQKMTVHANPTLRDAIFDTPSRSLLVRGNNIPDWIDKSDVTATFENKTVIATEVKSNHIKFDIRSWNLNPIQTKPNNNQLKNTQGYTTLSSNYTHPGVSNETKATDYPDAQALKETITPQATFLPPVFHSLLRNPAPTNKPISGDKMNTRATATFRTTKSVIINGGNKTDFSTVTARPGDDSTTKSVIKRTVKFRIKIGNHQEELDFEFYPDDNETSEIKEIKHVPNNKLDIALFAGAGAGGAGVLLLLLVIVSCVMYTRARKAQALVKEQAFYMSSLSGSQHGSKEGALPSLKQILQSVIEPDQRADMDRLVISLECLTVGKSIGSGNFGCVFEASLVLNKETPAEKVAVKTLQDPSSHTIDLHAFVKEAVLMREFQHPHVLGLIGLAEKEPGIPYVILPYMDNGDLLSFVRDSSVSLSLHDVVKFGADIASGMAYLSTLKFVHRDLAARNCMLDDQYRVKVADFGLCRDIYEKGYYTSDNRKKLPIRWMAVESIEHGAYSSKSDVWSLGVVLWELLSRGVTPYPGVNGWDVINFLRHRRLAPPYFCPDELYDLMMQCWAKEPNLRPDFITVQTMLLNMIGQSPTITDTMKRRRGDNLKTTVSNKGSLHETPSPNKKEDTKPEKIPRKTLQAAATKQKNKNLQIQGKDTPAQVTDSDRKEPAYLNVSLSSNNAVKNILITIPTCYSHRDVSKTAAGTYIQLVDNYEPPPKFSNPILRSIKKHSKKSHDSHPKVLKKGHDSVGDGSGYSIPAEYISTRSSNGDIVGDDLDGRSRNSEGSVTNIISRASNYYELENTPVRTSADSNNHSGWSTLCNSGSQASILEDEIQDSSLNISSASATSALSAPYKNMPQSSPKPAVDNKPSPLLERVGSNDKRIPKQRAIKPDGGRVKSADVLTYL